MTQIRTFFFNEDKNIWLLKTTCLFWFFAKLITWKMFTTKRLLPTAPVFEWLDNVPAVVHTILFVLSLLLIMLLFLKNNKLLLIGLLVTEIFSCLLDQNRLGAWEYFYFFIIFIFLINAGNARLIPASIALLLISSYFYAGLCKLNEGFLNTVWSEMTLRIFFKVPANIIAQKRVHYSGYLLGITEIAGGIGLLFAKTRVISARILMVMHLIVLIVFAPFVHRRYDVLWPWNISMIFFLYFIFLKENQPVANFLPVTEGWNKLVFLCWAILPMFSFFGYWDYNLSSNLFSANLPRMIICITDTSKCKPLLRFCSKRDILNTCHGLAKIDIKTWSIAETTVSAYPEMRTYKIMQKKLEKQYAAAGLSFVYLSR